MTRIQRDKTICRLVAYTQDQMIAASLIKTLSDSDFAILALNRPAAPLAMASPRQRRDVTGALVQSRLVMGLIADGEGVDEWYEWTLSRARTLGKCVCGLRVPGAKASTPLLYKYLGLRVVNYRPGLALADVLGEVQSL